MCFKYHTKNFIQETFIKIIFLISLMIKKIDNLILVGTSHVSKESIETVKKVIDEYQPSVIGIELDIDRLKKVLNEDQEEEKKEKFSFSQVRALGLFGYMFAKFGAYLQKKIGNSLGIKPGEDMRSTYLYGKENNIPVSLIDIPIGKTLRDLSRISFFRKVKEFFNLIFKSYKKEYRKNLSVNIKDGKVPPEKTIKAVIGMLKKEAPTFHKILIHNRNIYMSNKLLNLQKYHDGIILGVVGAGHVEGMVSYLEKNSISRTHNEKYEVENHIESKLNLYEQNFL